MILVEKCENSTLLSSFNFESTFTFHGYLCEILYIVFVISSISLTILLGNGQGSHTLQRRGS